MDRPVIGVVLAGGKGTRLYPATIHTNKHLLTMGLKRVMRDTPPLAPLGKLVPAAMVDWPIETLLRNGIDLIDVVTGPEHTSSLNAYLEDGSNYLFVPEGCPNPSVHTTNQPIAGGISDALRRVLRVVPPGAILVVILGDNMFIGPWVYTVVAKYLEQRGGEGARIFGLEVPDWHKFGVILTNEDGTVKEIVEKPKEYIGSRKVAVGLYIYPAKDVFKHIDTLKPSDRGELEVTALNNCYIREGQLDLVMVEGPWLDMGDSVDSYADANFILTQMAHGLTYEDASMLLQEAKLTRQKKFYAQQGS